MIYAIASYAWWGLFPLYWKLLQAVPATEILAHRVFWSFVFFVVLVAIRGKRREFLAMLSRPRYMVILLLSALLITSNWGVYIYSVNSGQILEASLGYFLNPLLNVVLGMLFLRERLTTGRWIAVGIAVLGVVQLTAGTGAVPLLALFLGLTFALYAFVRKLLGVNSLVGMTVETLFLAPAALVYFSLFSGSSGAGPAFMWSVPTALLLALGGVITALPLLWFTEAANRLSLSTLGICQYISPSLQFLLALIVFKEPFSFSRAAGFICIWAALFVYSVTGRSNAGPGSRLSVPQSALR